MAEGLERYTKEAHQADFWLVSEAANEFGVRSAFNTAVAYTISRVSSSAATEVDQGYLNDLSVINNGLGYQGSFDITGSHINGLLNLLGDSEYMAGLISVFKQRVDERQALINGAIKQSGSVAVMLHDKDTSQLDSAAWQESLRRRVDEDSTEAVPMDAYQHPGIRVARVIECLGTTSDWYYRFAVEGKSGTRYDLNPRLTTPRIMVDSRTSIVGTGLPIRPVELDHAKVAG